jgi:2'-5' RNA ligase
VGRHRGSWGDAPPHVPRLFVAVPVPPEVGTVIGELMSTVRAAMGPDGSRVRWVQLEGLHMTLRFLGPTPASQVPSVAAALDRAAGGQAAFDIRLAGSGAFPAPDRPRALWLGIAAGAEAMGAISAAFETELVELGWELEARPFKPHLTIARTDGVRAGPAAVEALGRAALDLDAGFRATEVVLYRSHLGSGPARYERLHAVALD